jgi:hypothetical protein
VPPTGRPTSKREADDEATAADSAVALQEEAPARSSDGQSRPAQSGDGSGSKGQRPWPELRRDEHARPASDELDDARLGSTRGAPVPVSYTELDALEDPTGLAWDRRPAQPPDQASEPSRTQLEALRALYELRFMLGTQLVRRFWPEARGRSERRRCAELFEPGWTRRFQITTRGGGQKHRIYMVTRQGVELLKQHRGPRGPYVDPDARWQEPQIEDARRVIHDLHVAAWLLAFEALAERLVRSWRGARSSRVRPPTRREGRERLPLRPQDIPLGGSRRIRDLALEGFKPISPDATIELALAVASPPHRFDLLLELDRTGRPSGNVEKFRRYDALMTGWARAHDRYKVQGEPPVVVFAVEDEPKARAFIDAADTAITGAVLTPGTAPEHWEYPGRERTFFVCERDVHLGTLRSYRLPRYPPDVRKAQRGDHRRSRNRPEPEQLPLLERRLLRR